MPHYLRMTLTENRFPRLRISLQHNRVAARKLSGWPPMGKVTGGGQPRAKASQLFTQASLDKPEAGIARQSLNLCCAFLKPDRRREVKVTNLPDGRVSL